MEMKKLLIVVDYQNDFVDGSLGFGKAVALDGVIAKKIREYRESGDTVAFTFDTHESNYLETQEGEKLPVPHCIERTEGWALFGETAEMKRDSDPIFLKETFGSSSLFNWLREDPFDVIELCGLVLNICVISNAVLAKTAQPEAEIVVDAKATASADDKIYEETLDVLEGLQVSILNR